MFDNEAMFVIDIDIDNDDGELMSYGIIVSQTLDRLIQLFNFKIELLVQCREPTRNDQCGAHGHCLGNTARRIPPSSCPKTLKTIEQ